MKYFWVVAFCGLGLLGCNTASHASIADVPVTPLYMFFSPSSFLPNNQSDYWSRVFRPGEYAATLELHKDAIDEATSQYFRWEVAFASDHPGISATWKRSANKTGKGNTYSLTMSIAKTVPAGMHRIVLCAIGYDQQGQEKDHEYTAQVFKLRLAE